MSEFVPHDLILLHSTFFLLVFSFVLNEFNSVLLFFHMNSVSIIISFPVMSCCLAAVVMFSLFEI